MQQHQALVFSQTCDVWEQVRSRRICLTQDLAMRQVPTSVRQRGGKRSAPLRCGDYASLLLPCPVLACYYYACTTRSLQSRPCNNTTVLGWVEQLLPQMCLVKDPPSQCPRYRFANRQWQLVGRAATASEAPPHCAEPWRSPISMLTNLPLLEPHLRILCVSMHLLIGHMAIP